MSRPAWTGAASGRNSAVQIECRVAGVARRKRPGLVRGASGVDSSRLRSPPALPATLVAIFYTGDRVLVCTNYGELVARILGIIDGTTYRVRPLHPAFVDCRNGIYAREADVRRPMDAAADEPMRKPGNLFTSRPAWTGESMPGDPGMPAPRKRVKRTDRDE